MSRTAWIWVLIIVLVVIAVWAFLSYKNAEQSPNPEPAGATDSITVNDQAAGSLAVTVARAELSAPGFIVIHEGEADETDPKATPVIGVSGWLDAGVHTNISILATLKPEKTYWAMLHKDDGNRVFNGSTDLPFLGAADEPIMTRFIVGDVLGEVKG